MLVSAFSNEIVEIKHWPILDSFFQSVVFMAKRKFTSIDAHMFLRACLSCLMPKFTAKISLARTKQPVTVRFICPKSLPLKIC